MKEYIAIDHIDQLFSMPDFRQRAFRDEVRNYMKHHPFQHLKTEWGRFDGVQLKGEAAKKLAKEVLSEMTLEQKVNQMSGDYPPALSECAFERYNVTPFYAGEDLELNIPAVKFTDGPAGVVIGYHSTAFPAAIARAASFNTQLETRIGEAIGIEARSLGANLFAGVCINVLRHPGWGRAQETYGEDPCLLGKMGCASISGVQKHVMACVKHFAANSMENSRFKVDVQMSERTLREVYLPHFKKCIEAGAAAVMSAYNRFRGQWCGHNNYLLTEVLKKEWEFDGFVMSDFGYGIRGTIEPANAGLDLEMNNTQFFGKRLVKAVRDGLVSEDKINDAVLRLLLKKIEFASVGDKELYGYRKPACPEHIALAKEAAEESIVLLKNNGLLPLNKEKVKKILIAGDLAKLGAIGDSKGSSAVFAPYIIDNYTGLANEAPNVQFSFVRGVVADEVRQKGKMYDAVIVFVGLTYEDEGEYFADSDNSSLGGDRKDLSLPKLQWDMIEAACEGNKNTIVVIQGGGAVEMESFKAMPAAILMQWYPGMEGGSALAEIIFGKINPSAKLPVSIYAKPWELPYFEKDVTEIQYDYDHGYFAADKYGYHLTYPFGFGLSYTSFYISAPVCTVSDNCICAEVSVTNIGERAGAEVVQLYIGYEDSAVSRHVKELKDFKKVYLKPRETVKVLLKADMQDLAYYDEENHQWIEEKITYIVYTGNSSSISDLKSTRITL